MSKLFTLPHQVLLSNSGALIPGAKAYFYAAGTATPLSVYTEYTLTTPHSNPVVADGDGRFAAIYYDPAQDYKVVLKNASDVEIYTQNYAASALSTAEVGAALYPRTTAEISAGVTPTNYQYEPGDVRRYGAVGDGVTDDTTAIQNALSIDAPMLFYDGTYLCNNLTQTHDFQRIYSNGEVVLKKNANGDHFTSSGDNVELNGIGFRGDASSPTFTGDGIVMSGDNPRLINCGSRWCPGLPVKLTGSHAQIIGTCDIYQTTDATASGYDIQIGVSGTATLYHQIINVYSSQSTGGIRFIDTGSHSIVGGQYGKLSIDAGTSPSGVNGGSTVGCRITGNVSVNLSNANFASNTFGGSVALTLAAGTAGHSIGASNVFAVGATITDNSNNSEVVDSRDSVNTSYTPAWTGASVNPAIGDGSISGVWSKRGKHVTVQVIVTMGSTTTYGTGAWSFSVPFAPSTSVPGMGSALAFDSGTNFKVGTVFANTGASTVAVYFDGDVAQADSAKPFTWASGDVLRFGITYLID